MRSSLCLLAGWLLCACAANRAGVPQGEDKPWVARIDDALQIDVSGRSDLSSSYRIDPQGGIDYPYLGRLTVAGLKPAEIEKLIVDGFQNSGTALHRVSVEIKASSKPAK